MLTRTPLDAHSPARLLPSLNAKVCQGCPTKQRENNGLHGEGSLARIICDLILGEVVWGQTSAPTRMLDAKGYLQTRPDIEETKRMTLFFLGVSGVGNHVL